MELTRLIALIDDIIKNNVSDLHFTTGEFPHIRNNVGDIAPVEAFGKMTPTDMERVMSLILLRPFTEITCDVSYERNGTRFRVNISRIIGGISIAMRTIPSIIPEPSEIYLNNDLLKLTNTEKGIILFTGPTGSGKSTSMATMIEHINRNSARHVITLEDPVEFLHKNKFSLIHQRELGTHFTNFPDGIRSILREDPDVIVV